MDFSNVLFFPQRKNILMSFQPVNKLWFIHTLTFLPLRHPGRTALFKKAATNILNGFNVSSYEISELDRFKTILHQTLLERDTLDWKTRIVKNRIEILDLNSHWTKKIDFIYLLILIDIFQYIFNLYLEHSSMLVFFVYFYQFITQLKVNHSRLF